MKKHISLICAAILLVMIMFCLNGCSTQTFKDDSKLEYTIVDNEIAVTGYKDSTSRTEIKVPDEINGLPVTTIADFGLFNSESLQTIYIGKYVREISEWSMTNNQSLKEFVVDEGNEYYCSVDGVLFSKDMKTIIYYPPAKNIEFSKHGEAQNTTQYTIPEGVETIRSKAFYKCYYIDKIMIPDSVKSIEEKAFHRTSALTELTLPDGLEYIGKDAFSYCDKIEKVVVPASVKEIDEYAFFNCSGIKELHMNCKESDVNLGDNWYPTSNGKQIKDCEIIWK